MTKPLTPGVGNIPQPVIAFGGINPDRRYRERPGPCCNEEFDGAPYGLPNLPLGSQYIPSSGPADGTPMWTAEDLFAYQQLGRGLQPGVLGPDLPAVEELPKNASCPDGYEYVGTDCARVGADGALMHAPPKCSSGAWDADEKACVDEAGGIPWLKVLAGVGIGAALFAGVAAVASTKRAKNPRSW